MECTLVSSRPFFDKGPLALDDQLLQTALCEQGIATQVVPWEEPHDWSGSDLTLLRSTWNYYLHYESFLAWVRTIAQQTVLESPREVVLWNAHKRYLTDLAHHGVPTIPTLWLPRGSYRLQPLMHAARWAKAVLKPCIAANSHHAYLLTPQTQDREYEQMEQRIAEQDMMLQPYLEAVAEEGEHSHVFVNGRWSHAFERRPFQVQSTHVLDEPSVCPGRPEIDFATGVFHVVQRLFRLTQPLLYARVDVVNDGERYRIMEVELIEPKLHLEYGSSLAALAQAIAHRLYLHTTAQGRHLLSA